MSVDLRRASGSEWRTVATDRRPDERILDALDFREVGSPARWALDAGTEAVSP